MGYYETGKLDTVPAILLVTPCDSCMVFSVPGFTVRKQFSYQGDRMPPATYDDYWTVFAYLGEGKKRLLDSVTVWDYRLKSK